MFVTLRNVAVTSCRNVANQRSYVIIIAQKEGGAWERIINPRRACAERVTVVVSCVCLSVCLSVCMYVCLSEHAILAVHAIRSITKDAIVLSVRFAAVLKRRVFFNCLIRKLERFSLTLAGAVDRSSFGTCAYDVHPNTLKCLTFGLTPVKAL